MDIERELTANELEHLHGKCHLVAIALCRLTGLPLSATLDVDGWTERTVLVHAYIKNGDYCIDVRGQFEIATISDDFEVNDPWDVVGISEEDLLRLGNGRRVINESSHSYQKALKLAEGVVEQLGLPLVASAKL